MTIDKFIKYLLIATIFICVTCILNIMSLKSQVDDLEERIWTNENTISLLVGFVETQDEFNETTTNSIITIVDEIMK